MELDEIIAFCSVVLNSMVSPSSGGGALHVTFFLDRVYALSRDRWTEHSTPITMTSKLFVMCES